MAHGKHRKPEDHTKAAAIVTTGALSLAGIAAFGGTANAASEDAWDRIAACESGDMNTPGSGQWNRPDGHASSTGGLQIQLPTWNDFGGQEFAPEPYLATKAQQIAVAERILAGQGAGAWVCNNPGHGIASGALDGEPAEPDQLPDAVPGDSHPSAKDDAPPPAPANPKRGSDCVHSTHTVEPGDTLYGITKAHTGNGALDNWEPLYEANRDVVGSDPDLIFPGQVLSLPWADTDHAPAEEAPAPAPEPEPEPAAPAGGYSAPLDGIGPGSNGYGNVPPGISYALGYHTGTDFPAPTGTPVKAVADGKVIAGDTSPSYGINVKIAHTDGTYSFYAHLSGTDVFEGQEVSAGQQIGSVGNTGTGSFGSHLHLEIRVTPSFGAGNFIDPVVWLASKGITL